MKKFKKILIPLLMIVCCVPLFLAGCGSNNTGFIQSSKDGQIWYGFDNDKKLINVYFIKNKNLSLVSFDPTQNITVNEIKRSNNNATYNTAMKLAKSIDKNKKVQDGEKPGANYEKDLSLSYKVKSNSKSAHETITYGYENESSFTLTDPNTKVKIDGKTYTGYKYKDNNDASNDGYLVTNTNQKLGFDKKNN